MPEFVDEIVLSSTKTEGLPSPSAFQTKRHGWFKAAPPMDRLLKTGVKYLFEVRPGTLGPDTLIGFREWNENEPAVKREASALAYAEVFEESFTPFLGVAIKKANEVIGKNAARAKGGAYLDFVYKVAFTGWNEYRNRGRT